MNNENKSQLIKIILESLGGGQKEQLIRPFEFGKSKKNELLFFFKPECFKGGVNNRLDTLFQMVFDKLDRFGVEISGALLLTGERLAELSIMDRHYGFINKMSREVSQLVSADERIKIREALGLEQSADFKLLGGHQFLEQYPGFDIPALKQLWRTKDSLKLRSGFYFQEYEVENSRVVLVNGFHPSQLLHYTDPSHSVVLLLLNSDTDWKTLKWEFCGDTYPENAEPHSIRGEIYADCKKFDICEISISANCVHLSAGPFEALFEINNFLKDTGIRFNLRDTNIARLMSSRGLSEKDLKHAISNPTVSIDGKSTDLFTHTEEENSYEAIETYLKHFTG